MVSRKNKSCRNPWDSKRGGKLTKTWSWKCGGKWKIAFDHVFFYPRSQSRRENSAQDTNEVTHNSNFRRWWTCLTISRLGLIINWAATSFNESSTYNLVRRGRSIFRYYRRFLKQCKKKSSPRKASDGADPIFHSQFWHPSWQFIHARLTIFMKTILWHKIILSCTIVIITLYLWFFTLL
jgi:hypothetical protein